MFVGEVKPGAVYYCDETIENVVAQIEAVTAQVEAGISREQLLKLLPAGGARNAIDCALWDLETKYYQKSIWDLTGITPKPYNHGFER